MIENVKLSSKIWKQKWPESNIKWV
jgi:hypothetical protein